MKAIKLFLMSFFVVGALAYLNAIIPAPQKADATHNPVNSAGCSGVITVSTNENPSACNNGDVTASLAHAAYSATYTVTSNDGALELRYNTQAYSCPQASPHDAGGTGISCRQNGDIHAATTTIGGTHQTANITILGKTMSCGSQQTDLSFQVWKNGSKVCEYGTPQVVWGHSFCSTGIDCGTPQTHHVCQNNACVQITGSGSDSCSTNSDCTPATHLGCQNNECVSLPGAGDAQCIQSPNSCAAPQHHNVCENNACVQKDGPGDSTCKADSDCTTVTPTITPTTTPTIITCFNKDNQLIQVGINDIALCQNQNQNQSQNQYNNQTVNVNVQQQQQQAVLGASVAPAPSTTQLPSTGAEGFATIATLLSLIPAGLKIRKLV